MGVAIAIVFLVVVFVAALAKVFASGDPSQRDAILLLIFGAGAAVLKFLADRVDLKPGFRMMAVRYVVVVCLWICILVCLYEVLMFIGADAGAI